MWPSLIKRQLGHVQCWKVLDQPLDTRDQPATWAELCTLWKASVIPSSPNPDWHDGKTAGTGAQVSYEVAHKQHQGPFLTTALRSSHWSAAFLLPLVSQKAPFSVLAIISHPYHYNILLCSFSQLEELSNISLLYWLLTSHGSVKYVHETAKVGENGKMAYKQITRETGLLVQKQQTRTISFYCGASASGAAASQMQPKEVWLFPSVGTQQGLKVQQERTLMCSR